MARTNDTDIPIPNISNLSQFNDTTQHEREHRMKERSSKISVQQQILQIDYHKKTHLEDPSKIGEEQLRFNDN